jgi:hypothetical protein
VISRVKSFDFIGDFIAVVIIVVSIWDYLSARAHLVVHVSVEDFLIEADCS